MNLSRLTYCNQNQKVKIAEIDGSNGAVENLKTFGITIGDEVLFKSRKNGHGKITVEHNNKEISLGYELASKILLESSEISIITLDQVRVGDIVEVTKMGAKGDIRFRLLDMGLVKGVEIKILRVAPLGDPIEILINSFNLSLRIDEAKNIEVKVIEIIKNHHSGKKRWGIF
ncbi:MAG: ferrous iron transport protein A [Melioribacteraceae bacterium]|nr:ferrous iron transport protein A [Melioribacteraceae bacterium]